MPAGARSSFCEDIVRRADPDRYLASLFAPAKLRPDLFALYAFNYEVARIAEIVSQPIMGQIRLQWWRDRIEEMYAGAKNASQVVKRLGEAVQSHDLPKSLFAACIDAREHDLDEAPFADLASLEAYADATSGNVMRLAARIMGAGNTLDADAREAGIAYALTGLLRAVPFHAAHHRAMLPQADMTAAGISPEDLFAGRPGRGITGLFARIAQTARIHHAVARGVSRGFLPALLPAALVPSWLDRLARPGFDPFRDLAEIPGYRRQWIMVRAMARGRI